MAWNTRTNWSALGVGQIVNPSDLDAPGLDVRTWGGDVNGGGYTLSNAVIYVENWISLTLQNSWVAFGTDGIGTWPTPAYRKDMSGRVWLRGRMKSGTITTPTTIFVLPVGYRPKASETVSLLISAPFSAPNLPQLVILDDGTAKIYNVTANSYLDLNVSFSTT